ncbi:MAG: outer membrane beta-barrel protein, partial [Mariniphaga sp.]
RAMISRNAAAIKVPGNERAGWRMGVNVSPGYSSYAVKHGNDYASNMTQVANDGNANVSGGVAIRYNTSRRWSLESGIYYAQNGKQAGSSPQVYGSREQALYSAAPERLYFNTAVTMETSGVAMNSIAGVIEIENMPAGAEIAADLENAGFYGNSLITQGELSQVFDLVEIPLYLRYLLVDSNLDVELLGGINAGVIVGNQAFLENQFGVQRIGRTRDISTMNFSGALGLAFSYALGKNFSLGVEPRFNYYMTSISRNPEVDFRPYRIGVYTGLYYSF